MERVIRSLGQLAVAGVVIAVLPFAVAAALLELRIHRGRKVRPQAGGGGFASREPSPLGRHGTRTVGPCLHQEVA